MSDLGHGVLIRSIDRFRHGKKGYIVQELGGTSMSKALSDIQGVFYNNERVYEVNFKDVYHELAFKNGLKNILLQICHGVELLNNEGFIHCDLKSENVLIQKDN